jgi:hypothetical protein
MNAAGRDWLDHPVFVVGSQRASRCSGRRCFSLPDCALELAPGVRRCGGFSLHSFLLSERSVFCGAVIASPLD